MSIRIGTAVGSLAFAGALGVTGIAASWRTRTPAPPLLLGNPILEIHADSLTTYRASSATPVQSIRPLVGQRGVNLDGSLRAGPSFPMNLAGNPFENAWRKGMSGAIRLSTGTYVVSDVDLALPAAGFSWVVGRSYNAHQLDSGAAHRDSDGFQGKNWFQNSLPEIRLYDDADNTKDLVYLVYAADAFVELKRVSSSSNSYRAVNGAAGVMQFATGAGSEPDTYTYFDQHGIQFVFFGFDNDSAPAQGQLWKIIDPATNTAFIGDATTGSTAITNGFDSGGRATKAYDSADRRYTYTYSTLSSVTRLTEVKAETKTGGTWASPTGVAEVGKVTYGYYGDESYGDAGALKLVTIATPLTDSGVSLTQKRYYRYWEGPSTRGRTRDTPMR